MAKKRIMGWDISSTACGYCSLEIDDITNEIVYLSSGVYKPNKEGSIIERLVETRNAIRSVIEAEKPDYIGIEDIVQFMKGQSTAQTIIMLTTFNRMTGLCAYDYLSPTGIAPELFSVMTIRHGLKKDKIFPKKEEMPELVASHLGIQFPYIYKENGKNKGEIRVDSYDRADGIAVALYYAFKLTGRTKKARNK